MVRCVLLTVALAAMAWTGWVPGLAHATPVLEISSENSARHFQVQTLSRFADALNQRLGHRLTIQVVPDGKLYRGRDVIDALNAGRADIAAPGVWHLSRFVPDFAALQLPILYGRSEDVFRRQVDGRLGRLLTTELENRLDVHVLGSWLDLGYAHVFTRGKKVDSPADLKGLRIRVAGGAANSWRIEALGAEPVVIPWPDFPRALEDGLVDGTLTTPTTVVSARLWERGLDHAYIDYEYYPYYVPLISGTLWRRLSPVERTAVEQAWRDVVDDGRQRARDAQSAALRTLERNGVTITHPSADILDDTRQRLLAGQDALVRTLGLGDDAFRLLTKDLP